jgi:hypothetical protein
MIHNVEVTFQLPSVMSLLDNNEGDAGLVVSFQFNASFADGSQLMS